MTDQERCRTCGQWVNPPGHFTTLECEASLKARYEFMLAFNRRQIEESLAVLEIRYKELKKKLEVGPNWSEMEEVK